MRFCNQPQNSIYFIFIFAKATKVELHLFHIAILSQEHRSKNNCKELYNSNLGATDSK